MVSELMRDFAVGGAILGNLSAFYFYAYAVLQVPVGVLMDRIGPRRLLAGAALVSAVGSLIFASSEALAGAYVGRMLIGAGVAFSWVGVLTVAAQWFPPTRFAFLAGVGQAVGMAGGVFGQAPLAMAVGEVGWRGTLIGVGCAGLVLGLLMWIVVRDRQHEATASVGILASLGTLLKNRETWLNAVFGLATAGPMLGFAGLWSVPYLTTVYGLDRAAAAGFASLMFIGWAVGSPIAGMIADRLCRRKLLMVVGAACAASTLAAIVYLPDLPLLVLSVLMVVHGATASVMVLSFACVREHNPPGMSSSAMGIVNVAVVGSGALFQPLIGLLLDLNWGGTLLDGARIYDPGAYRVALSVLIVGCAFGFIASLLMRESYGRQRAAA